jgi:hypothetical protein
MRRLPGRCLGQVNGSDSSALERIGLNHSGLRRQRRALTGSLDLLRRCGAKLGLPPSFNLWFGRSFRLNRRERVGLLSIAEQAPEATFRGFEQEGGGFDRYAGRSRSIDSDIEQNIGMGGSLRLRIRIHRPSRLIFLSWHLKDC